MSKNAMNTIKLVPAAEPTLQRTGAPEYSTSSDSFSGSYDGSSSSKPRDRDASRSGARLNGTNSQLLQASPQSIPRAQGGPPGGAVRLISQEFGQVARSSNGFLISEDSNAASSSDSSQWSSAIGKANLGKSGRVIERLMGENDMLKRDLNIANLATEESRQAAKMTESRMEKMVDDYERTKHAAAIDKSLLKKRDRQVLELRSQIDEERRRAESAAASERLWKDTLEEEREESKAKVIDAENARKLMEGRYEALAGHWREQGQMVKTTVTKVHGEINAIVEDRKTDGERMILLETMCRERDERLIELSTQNAKISRLFDEYRKEQESLLHDIKTRAKKQQAENDETLRKTKQVMGELKWALNVNANLK